MNRFKTVSLNTVCFIGAFCIATVCAAEEDSPAITPYRPSVSNSAQLSAPGQLELELGVLTAHSGDATRHSVPYLLKLAGTSEWGVLLGGEAVIAANDGAGQTARGLGDTSIVIKRAFLIDDATAFGVEFGSKIPTARDALGSGKTDFTANGIWSQDLASVHLDVNLNQSHLGAADVGVSQWQTGLSSALSVPFNAQWGLVAEWSGLRQTGAKAQGQTLFALSFSPTKRMTFDVGFTKGLTSATPDWSLFAGVVLPLAKLW